MIKTVRLGDAITYRDEKTSLNLLNIATYVTTDNLLANKKGLKNAANLPPTETLVSKFRKGDILLSNIRPYLKKIWLADRDGGCSADVLVLSTKNKFNNKFIYYSLLNDVFFDYVMKGAKGTKMPRGDKDHILEFLIPDLDQYSQAKVSDVLEAYDKKLNLNIQLCDLIENLLIKHFKMWFLQFDFPVSRTNYYKKSGGQFLRNNELQKDIPTGWLVRPLKELIDLRDGTHDSPAYVQSGFPLITSKNILGREIDLVSVSYISKKDYEDINRRSKVDKGDILFSMIGNVGTVYKVEEEPCFAIKNVALYKTSQNSLLKNYIFLYLQSTYMTRYMKAVMGGSVQKFIGLEDLRNMPVLYNEEIIKSFNELTSPLFLKHETLVKEISFLRRYRDYISKALIGGTCNLSNL